MKERLAHTITLTQDQTDYVGALVEKGSYASMSKVVQEGLAALQSRDDAIEQWLRDEVVPTYDEVEADPSLTISAEQMIASLKAHYEAALKHAADEA